MASTPNVGRQPITYYFSGKLHENERNLTERRHFPCAAPSPDLPPPPHGVYEMAKFPVEHQKLQKNGNVGGTLRLNTNTVGIVGQIGKINGSPDSGGTGMIPTC